MNTPMTSHDDDSELNQDQITTQALEKQKALQEQGLSFTKNGGLSYLSTSHPLLDLFSMAGSARNHLYDLYYLYAKAKQEDPINTFKLLFWLRDAKNGAGERRNFQIILTIELLNCFEKQQRALFDALLSLIPTYGYWKDLLAVAYMEKAYFEWILDFLAKEIQRIDQPHSLLAKYLPRPRGGTQYQQQAQEDGLTEEKACDIDLHYDLHFGKKDPLRAQLHQKAAIYDQRLRYGKNKIKVHAFDMQVIQGLCQRLGFTQGQYRKWIVAHSQTVEQTMSSKKWNQINYAQIPSLALMMYQASFQKRDALRYQLFLKALKKNKSKVNRTHILPHHLIHLFSKNKISRPEFELYWKNLSPCEGLNGIFPIIDFSGSMLDLIKGTRYSCLDVALGLGLYVATKQAGAYQNQVMIFSKKALWFRFSPKQSVTKMIRAFSWMAANTDFKKTYEKLLNDAKARQLKASELPKALLILSDMEFDAVPGTQNIPFAEMKKLFHENGYELPRVIFWNLNGRAHHVQVKDDHPDSILISGYSIQLLKGIMRDGLGQFDRFTPMRFLNTLLAQYELVEKTLTPYLTEI
jgi:hypothetical protein